MGYEAVKVPNRADQTFQTRRDVVLSSETPPINTAASWYQGIISEPSPGIHAVFNGPLVRTDRGLLHISRAMRRKQVPGISDHTDFFDISQIGPSGVIHLPPMPVEVITGRAYADFGVEDLRIRRIGDTYICGGTAEEKGSPHPMEFSFHVTPRGLEVRPMELLEGVSLGKNALPWGPDMMLYRKETDDDAITVLKRNKHTDSWDSIDSIHFPYISAYNEYTKNNGGGKKRVGLTGGESIPMPNGNFRLIIHEVTHSGAGYGAGGNIAEYQFRLAEFREDKTGIPRLVAVDPIPLLTYDDVIALVGSGEEPDPTKRVIYSDGGALIKKRLFFPVTVRDKEEHLFVIPLTVLQHQFESGSMLT